MPEPSVTNGPGTGFLGDPYFRYSELGGHRWGLTYFSHSEIAWAALSQSPLNSGSA